MKYDELDKKMRVYEESLDQIIIPDMFLVARLDGKNFTRLTKEVCQFEAPYEIRFRDIMVKVVKKLMECGFRVIYGFTESDEISLLFHPNENAFGRKVRKYNSILAGVASAIFSMELYILSIFYCRIIPLPSIERVQDYFRWRQEDAYRNALNSHCYWTLRKDVMSVQDATDMLSGKSIAFKNELLFQHNINFNDLPSWQKRGVGIWWTNVEVDGYNPIANEAVSTSRRVLHEEYELPLGEEYGDMIKNMVAK